jgi:hypothetical protein
MSRLIAGQLRLLEESSVLQAMHLGLSFGDGENSKAPKAKEQDHPNLQRDVSHRGRGKGIKGAVEGAVDLVKESTYKEPFQHFSVGFDLSKEDPKDLDKKLLLKRRGKRNIIHPERMGRKDASNMSLPHKKEHKPPKNLSSIVKKESKKVVKHIKEIDNKPFSKFNSLALHY